MKAKGKRVWSFCARGANNNLDSNIGKKVFTGKADLSEFDATREPPQREVLTSITARLPRRARSKAELVELAGRLADEQLDALRYYVKVRYKIEDKRDSEKATS